MEFRIKSCFGCGSFDLEGQQVTTDTNSNEKFDFFCTLLGLPTKQLIEIIGIVNKVEFCGNCHAALENAATIMRQIEELEKSLGEIKGQVSAKIASKCQTNYLTADKMSKIIAQCVSTCQVVVSPLVEKDVRKFTRKRRSKKKAKNFISKTVKLEKIEVTDAMTAEDLLDKGSSAVAESVGDNEGYFPQIIEGEENKLSSLNALNNCYNDNSLGVHAKDKKEKTYRCHLTPKKRKSLEDSSGKKKRKAPPTERKCAVCKEVFKLRSDLSEHMSSVHNQNIKTSCKHCGLDYSSCIIKFPEDGSASCIIPPEEVSSQTMKSPEEGSSSATESLEEISSSGLKSSEVTGTLATKYSEGVCSSAIKSMEEGSSSATKSSEEGSSSYVKGLEEGSSSCIKGPEEGSSSYIKSAERSLIKTAGKPSSSSEPVYACNMGNCKRTYKTMFDFRRHHAGKCPQNFGLRKHKQETRICEYCAKTFKNMDVLKMHIAMMHEHAFNFYCEHCGKGFVARSSCMDHVKNVHSTEKRYACDECPAKFKLPRQLVLHKRRHTGELPFVCEHCGKAFPMRSHWRKHMTNMHARGEFKCPMCPKTFASPNYVFNHISFVHHGFRGGNKKAIRPPIITQHDIRELVNETAQLQSTSNDVPIIDDGGFRGGNKKAIRPPIITEHDIPELVNETAQLQSTSNDVPTIDDGGRSPLGPPGHMPDVPQVRPPTLTHQPALSPDGLHNPVSTEPNPFLPAAASGAVGMSFLPPLPAGYLLPREVMMSNFDKPPIDFKGNNN